MKKIIFFLFLLQINFCFSQSTPNYEEIKLEKEADYQTAEPSVLQATNYMLSTPFKENDVTRLKSLQFLIKWMSGTPDYTFSLDEVAGKISKENSELLGIYMACMTKYCIENKEAAKDAKLVKLNSVKLLLAYCENEANNIKMTKELKKFSEANKKGTLEKEL